MALKVDFTNNEIIRTRNDIRELANAHITKYWTVDFLETAYKLHFSLAIISLLFSGISVFYFSSLSPILLILGLLQYITACDYKDSFDNCFESVWRAMHYDKSIS